MKTVLAVCVGNICRSPMAEGLLAHSLPEMKIESAGIGALIGEKADALAQELMADRGIDISNHIARQITRIMCLNADLILVMETQHRAFIESRYPFARGKVFRLGDSANQNIPDPYREGRRVFEDSLELITQGCDFWVKKINKINGRAAI